jgi:predicted ATP-binding protein involved in virulence
MEAQYPITLVASGVIDGQLEQWSRELTGKKTQTTFGKARVIIDYAKKLQQQVRAGEQVSLPIVAYYGTGRLWKQIKASNKHPTESHSRLYGYHDALNPKSTYEAFEKWFTDISLAEYSDRFAKLKDNIAKINVSYMKILANQDAYEFLDATSNRSTELEHVRKAIDQCLFASGWNTLEYDFKWRELVVRSNDSNLSNFMPVARLSDGVKAMLSLTADIAYRCVQLNPHLVSPTKETNGIVLIDEVDLHLHPKWQQTVLNDLQKAFSSIQFIVTTHSPQVVSTVPSHQIRILDGNQVYSGEAGTKGAESSRILKRIFGTNTRPQNDPNTILLNEYLDLVYADKWNDGEAQKKRKELDNIYQGNEPELTKADLYIENRQWELEIEENQ